MDLLRYIPAVLRLMEHREDAERLIRLLAPAADEIVAIGPEAWPLIQKLWAAVRKEFPAVARATPKRLRKPRRAVKRK